MRLSTAGLDLQNTLLAKVGPMAHGQRDPPELKLHKPGVDEYVVL